MAGGVGDPHFGAEGPNLYAWLEQSREAALQRSAPFATEGACCDSQTLGTVNNSFVFLHSISIIRTSFHRNNILNIIAPTPLFAVSQGF